MVVLNDEPNMYSCRVLYIGSAPPVETLKGVEALQEPLRQRFPVDVDEVEGIDANIRVLPTALEVTYVESGQMLHFPLNRLSTCAGVTSCTVTDATTGGKHRQFVPVNTVKHDSRNPAIFAAIIRRNQGRQIAECHMFICNSTRDALHLVNAAATANMALKQQRKNHRIESTGTTRYENDVVVVKTGVVDGSQNGHVVNGGHAYHGRAEEVYVKSDHDTSIESRHYKIQPSVDRASSPETIYISFDKTNLVSTGDDTLEVRSRERAPSLRPSPRPYIESSDYSYRPIAPPPPPQPQPVMVARPLPLPPPRPVYVRAPQPQPVMVRAPPQPVMIRAPPPQPVMMRAPPQPVMVRAAPQPMMVRAPPPRPVVVQAPPPQPVMVRAPPQQPQRLYTRRMITVPPAPIRYTNTAPAYVRSRARSVSPIRGYSASRMSRKEGLYQPKWEGDTRRPASDTGFRMSRRDQFDGQQGPPRDFRQSQNMFLNERAFSRRVYADDGMAQTSPSYQYTNAYDFNNVMMYDRPTTKSNPRYSSSSDSEDGRDNRMSRNYSSRR